LPKFDKNKGRDIATTLLNPQSLLGLIGDDTSKSLSPHIHNSVYQRRNWPTVYKAFSLAPEDLADAFSGFKALKFRGINVTIPFKEKVITYLDELAPGAKNLKAVNTIKFTESRAIGYNTDYLAVKELIKEWQEEEQKPFKSALVLGAGGAARAVVLASLEAGLKEIYLSNRTFSKAENLQEDFSGKGQQKIKLLQWQKSAQARVIEEVDLIVDATSLGWQGKLFPGAEEGLSKETRIFDLSYGSPPSPLIKLARDRGCALENGTRMLLYQAREADKIWFSARKDTRADELFRKDILPEEYLIQS